MPPKIKTNRESILRAAFEVAKDEGITAVTAQSVSAVLNTSVAPIFREFQTIEELRAATAEYISAFHLGYLKDYPMEETTFLTYGIAYIQFAKEYPRLFELIMGHGHTTLREKISGTLTFVTDSARDDSGLGDEQAKELFLNVWIYTHGIACLVYKGGLAIAEYDEKRLLINAFEVFKKSWEQCGLSDEKDGREQ